MEYNVQGQLTNGNVNYYMGNSNISRNYDWTYIKVSPQDIKRQEGKKASLVTVTINGGLYGTYKMC